VPIEKQEAEAEAEAERARRRERERKRERKREREREREKEGERERGLYAVRWSHTSNAPSLNGTRRAFAPVATWEHTNRQR
jgi:hypothetical protein